MQLREKLEHNFNYGSMWYNYFMDAESSEDHSSEKPFTKGSVIELSQGLELLDHKTEGLSLRLDPDAGRFVEVEFIQEELGPTIGYVDKWDSEGVWEMYKKVQIVQKPGTIDFSMIKIYNGD